MSEYLYVIYCNDDNYKIGIASDIEYRLASLQTGNPYRLSVCKAYQFSDASPVERVLHMKFSSLRGVGEWFHLLKSDIDAIEEICLLLDGKEYHAEDIDDDAIQEADEELEEEIDQDKIIYKSIHVLESAIAYNRLTNGRVDKIERHLKIHIKPEDRGRVCRWLKSWNPPAVSIRQGGPDQGTFVTLDYGSSVEELLRLIRSGDIRVSPPGFDDSVLKSAAVLDSAIDALPGVTR